MLTVRYARLEMRHPVRAWIQVNRKMLIGLALMALAFIVLTPTAAEHCEVGATGLLDCPLLGEGLLYQAPAPEEPLERGCEPGVACRAGDAVPAAASDGNAAAAPSK